MISRKAFRDRKVLVLDDPNPSTHLRGTAEAKAMAHIVGLQLPGNGAVIVQTVENFS